MVKHLQLFTFLGAFDELHNYHFAAGGGLSGNIILLGGFYLAMGNANDHLVFTEDHYLAVS